MTASTLPYTRTPTGAFTFHQSISAEALLTLAEAIITERFDRKPRITSAAQAARFIKFKLATQTRQHLAVVLLDRQQRVIRFVPVCVGTIHRTEVYPREIIKAALQHNAASLILAQNQPSGIAQPGRHDAEVSAALQKVLAYLDITLLDHFIIGGNAVLCLSEHGTFEPLTIPQEEECR